MEGNGLAAEAVALLVLYLSETGKTAAARAGEGVWDQFSGAASKLFSRVKEKFAASPDAAEDLAKLEQDPQSPGRQTIVQERLSRFIDSDRQSAEELRELMEAGQKAGGDKITQIVNVSGGSVGPITQIGKNNS